MRPFLALALAITCCLTAQCHAGTLRINVLDGTINAGGNGFLDVLISSADTNSVNVDIASYEFIINSVGMPVGTLQFDMQVDDSSNSQYFMFGNSFGNPASLSNIDSTLVGGDLTADFNGVELSNTEKLLVRLELNHTLGIGQSALDAVGEEFNISLVAGIDTEFLSKRDTNNLSTAHGFTSNFGTVKIVAQPQVVPEPVSCLVFACGFATLLAVRRRSRCT